MQASSLEGLSLGTMLLALLGNALMVPRALHTRDVVWFVGSTWACTAGWGQLLSMALGVSAATGWVAQAAAAAAMCLPCACQHVWYEHDCVIMPAQVLLGTAAPGTDSDCVGHALDVCCMPGMRAVYCALDTVSSGGLPAGARVWPVRVLLQRAMLSSHGSKA